ncbi:hypothetical protein TRFO_03810 [Tritrichomonas foetus]|uniref:Uncharacterized protein n=1 Tax=Tritrichomonas foetus TaxID=1144522 RepID=A0A1J4KQA9_9EUKA|nr:hypothetical protein TRFO_03810 [Tritrichomonas foetus]|eukprot:OHT11621.1 hypothetical protein TRFO_03810 [Tritrichomonas foetus]
MWYEQNDQFVRAPTPQAFDRLVQDLEDNDTVLFQSIRLPSSKNNENQQPEKEESKRDDPIADVRNSRASVQSFQSNKNSLNTNFVSDEDEEIQLIKEKIAEVEFANAKKDEIIRNKDEQIASLQKQIQALRGTPARAMTSQSSRPSKDADMMQFYKSQYETTLFRYEKLKEVLSMNESVKQAQSARPIAPHKRPKK